MFFLLAMFWGFLHMGSLDLGIPVDVWDIFLPGAGGLCVLVLFLGNDWQAYKLPRQ